MSNPLNPTAEPVRVATAIQTVIIAVFVLAKVFGWWTWTDDQETAVLAAYGALVVALGAFTRGRVSPV